MADPEAEWTGAGALREQLAGWTRLRGKSPRLYPGALGWCLKKPGRELREKVELWLAWKRVARGVAEGTLGAGFDRAERVEIEGRVRDAQEAAKDEVWGGYRYAILADNQESDGLKVIDLGAGHASAAETLCGRVVAALRSQGLLSESVGAGYLERHWPPALKESGAWPLASLRQSFLNGALTRLLDPDGVLRGKVVEFVGRGDFGLASGPRPDGTYARVWYAEPVAPEEVAFEAGVVLLTREHAKALKAGPKAELVAAPAPGPQPGPEPTEEPARLPGPEPVATSGTTTLRLVGTVPPESWNRLGTRLLPKLRASGTLRAGVEFSVVLDARAARNLEAELRQALDDLGLSGQIRIERQ